MPLGSLLVVWEGIEMSSKFRGLPGGPQILGPSQVEGKNVTPGGAEPPHLSRNLVTIQQ